MGFNIGGALSGALGGFLVGGPAGAVVGGGIGGFAGGGGKNGKVSYSKVPQTKEAEEARKRLYEMATGEPPPVPRQKVAPLPKMGEERELARETAKKMIQPQDIFSLPEVQGIIQEATETGNLLTNRLGRMLQAAGSLTATTGRDVLGRAVTDVQKNLASSLAPFAMEERTRRREMIPILESLGLTEEERGRVLSQAELDAIFRQELTESQQLQTFTIPLLQSIISLQPGVQPIIPGQQPSSISEYSSLIGPLLGAVLQGGGAGGGGGGAPYNVDYLGGYGGGF